MQLTDKEKEMRDGKQGQAVRIAMSILSDIGDAVGAEEMVEIAHVHTDSGFYLVYTDGCLLLFPQNMSKARTMMTNSAKAANYIYSQAGLKAAYGSIKDCVDSAIEGKVIRRGSTWLR